MAQDLPTIGLRLHGGIDPQQCVELAKAAEINGLASVWFAENPFERGVLPAASVCAAATRRIRIGIGVWNPFTRHPTLIAMEIGALDALAQGRANLGIGSGIAAPIGKLGIDGSRRPLAALRDAFYIVRGLLRGEEVTYSGQVFSAKAVRLGYAPPRPEVPIFMAARGDKALALCGEIADGLIVSNMCPTSFTARAVDIVHKAGGAGRAGAPHVVQYVPCLPGADGKEARRAIKAPLGLMVKQYWATGQAVPSAKEALRHSGIPEADFQTAVDRMTAGAAPDTVLDDRFVDAFAVAGTAEDCFDRLASYRRGGVTEVALSFVGAEPIADIAYLGAALKMR